MMPAEFKISKATILDLKQILKLQKNCYQSEAALYNDFSIQPLTQTYTELVAESADGIIFLTGRINTKIIASVRGYSSKRNGFINKLIVDVRFQNKGYGKQMMAAMENELKGVLRIELFTGHKSKKNISLYESIGYKIFREKKMKENLTMVYLEKHLSKM